MKFTSLQPIAVLLLTISGLVFSAPAGAEEPKPIRALLVIGGCCHDYAAQKDVLTEGISARAPVEWTIAYDPDKTDSHLNPIYEKADWAAGYDVVVHDECSSYVTDPEIVDRILKPHREGLPAVVLHCGMHSYRTEGWPDRTTPWFAFTGLPSTGHGPQLPIKVTYVDRESPIIKGLEDWTTMKEELYDNSAGKLLDSARALARGEQTIKDRGSEPTVENVVVAWTNSYEGKTKVFATTLGHHTKTVGDARYLDLVTRGLLWSVDRLDDAHFKAPAKEVSAEGAATP